MLKFTNDSLPPDGGTAFPSGHGRSNGETLQCWILEPVFACDRVVRGGIQPGGPNTAKSFFVRRNLVRFWSARIATSIADTHRRWARRPIVSSPLFLPTRTGSLLIPDCRPTVVRAGWARGLPGMRPRAFLYGSRFLGIVAREIFGGQEDVVGSGRPVRASRGFGFDKGSEVPESQRRGIKGPFRCRRSCDRSLQSRFARNPDSHKRRARRRSAPSFGFQQSWRRSSADAKRLR